MIFVDDVRKRFSAGRPLLQLARRRSKTVDVLQGVSFSVDRGDRVALIGGNGAGKTTVLKLLATLLLPDAGTVRVGGFDVRRQGAKVRRLVGYVLADERSFHWRLTARENLEFFSALDGLHGVDASRRISTLLRRLDLDEVADRPFAGFSSGMKQRLAVARALLPRPRVLLMDEPTRSIDAAHAATLWELVRAEQDEADGCTLLVTHQIQEALAFCDRVLVLSGGRIALSTSARALESAAADLEGFVVSVRGLASGDLDALRLVPGIRDVQMASQVAGEQVLEVWVSSGPGALVGLLAQLTERGATVNSMQRSAPLLAVLQRLQADVPAEALVMAVAR